MKAKASNLARLKKLRPDRDIHDHQLKVGDRVRSCFFAIYVKTDDVIFGIGSIGHSVSYVEGELVTIGADHPKTGEKSYAILAGDYCHSNANGAVVRDQTMKGQTIYAPLNGSPTKRGYPNFGVIKVENANANPEDTGPDTASAPSSNKPARHPKPVAVRPNERTKRAKSNRR